MDLNVLEKELLERCNRKEGRVYFLGVGGSGMYGVARLSQMLGLAVTGCDERENQNTEALRQAGISLLAEDAPLPRDILLVVYSLAVSPAHPRLLEAAHRGIPIIDRAGFLGILMRGFPVRAAVAGSHGKSSTTAMCAEILTLAGRSPTVVSGASLRVGGDSFLGGKREVILVEACEYKDAFLSLCPTNALVLDVSWEHTDYFSSLSAVMGSFASFLKGRDVTQSVAPAGLFDADVTFGEGGDYTAKERTSTRDGSRFLLCRKGEALGEVSLRTLGGYQVENALGAAALCSTLGVSDADIVKGLSLYRGISRRMEKRGYLHGVPLYLDFAHHPKELRLAIQTAMELDRPLALVFEPHTYSRTRAFFEEYVSALRMPHMAGVLPIYAAREVDDGSVSSAMLAKRAGVSFLADYKTAARFLADAARGGCTLLLAGAGGVESVLSHLPFLYSEREI